MVVNFVQELINKILDNNYTCFLLIALISALSLWLRKHPRIHKYLFIGLLTIGMVIALWMLADSVIVDLSNNQYSIQIPSKKRSIEIEKFQFNLNQCNPQPERSIKCNLMITNHGKQQKLYLYQNETRLFDFLGNENYAASVSIGLREGSHNSSTDFPHEIPIKASVFFKEVELKGDLISLLEINTSLSKANFHNIRLSQ